MITTTATTIDDEDGAARVVHSSWWRALDQICRKRLNRQQLLRILTFLLHSKHQFREADIFRPKEHVERPRVNYTPVEALLLFVKIALSRLQADLATVRNDPDYRSKYPEHFRRHRNLVRLLMFASSPKVSGPLSEIERLRLYAQWSSLRHTWAQLHPDMKVRDKGRKTSRMQLDRIERDAGQLRLSAREVESIRAMCVYRRAKQARHEENSPALAAYLRDFLEYSRRDTPHGLYFHVAREICNLPQRERAELLSTYRLKIAVAFGLLPIQRALDRVGLCYLLAADAAFCGSPAFSWSMRDTADRLKASIPKVFESEYVARQFNWLDRGLRYQLRRDTSEAKPTIEGEVAKIIDRIGAVAEKDVMAAYEAVSRLPARPSLAESLYRSVARSWLGRLVDSAEPAVIFASFDDAVKEVLSHHRNEPTILAIARVGCVCRLLHSQGADLIDESFSDFELLIGVTVLSGDRQALVDQLYSGRHRFLEKLGFDGESTALCDLAEYFEALYGVTATPPALRHSSTPIDRVLFGARVPATTLRYTIDQLQERWKSDTDLPDLGVTVGMWADSYGLPDRRPLFRSDSSDSTIRRFFADCEELLTLERLVPSAQYLDPVTSWTTMAWAAIHMVRVLKRVQAANSEKKVQTALGTDRDLVARGITWAECALSLEAINARPAGRYRALDARKRLEEVRRKEADATLIERLAGEMLAIDEQRLDTTSVPGRRNRAIIRTERTLAQIIGRNWSGRFRRPVLIHKSPVLAERLALVQRMKTFNYGQLAEATEDRFDSTFEDAVADKSVDLSSPDVFDRVDRTSSGALDHDALRSLHRHLLKHNGAILDFFTNPGSGDMDWKRASSNGWGTVCFVVTAAQEGLQVQPFYLHVPEALIRATVEGAPDVTGFSDGLATGLVYWPDGLDGDSEPPTLLKELSQRLFPDYLLRALKGKRCIYVCPHRHLYQVPLHAFPIEEPLFTRGHEVSYALKTSHIHQLLVNRKALSQALNPWSLVQATALAGEVWRLKRWLGNNSWGTGRSVEQIVHAGAAGSCAVICCHGELDEARPGRARFRLWRGGRITADDLHRLGTSNDLGIPPQVDYSGSEWVIAACDAGGVKVGLRTAPGLALSLVTCGAARVTSCLYRVRPQVAAQFLSFFLKAREGGGGSAFTAAVRGMYNARYADRAGLDARARWAGAASFTSYGLFYGGTNAVSKSLLKSPSV